MGFKAYSGAAPTGVGPITSPGASQDLGAGGWHPTVLFMVGLVIAEIIAVGLVSRYLLK